MINYRNRPVPQRPSLDLSASEVGTFLGCGFAVALFNLAWISVAVVLACWIVKWSMGVAG